MCLSPEPSQLLGTRDERRRGSRPSEGGESVDLARSVPTTIKEVQQFLGFAGYYLRFVKHFADVAHPLHRLTERVTEFCWTDECQAAFDELRRRLVTSPVLAYPDYTKPFTLDTDASDTGIGGVLSQRDADGKERVIAYASRALSKLERNYCVTGRELLAVVGLLCPILQAIFTGTVIYIENGSWSRFTDVAQKF